MKYAQLKQLTIEALKTHIDGEKSIPVPDNSPYGGGLFSSSFTRREHLQTVQKFLSSIEEDKVGETKFSDREMRILDCGPVRKGLAIVLSQAGILSLAHESDSEDDRTNAERILGELNQSFVKTNDNTFDN